MGALDTAKVCDGGYICTGKSDKSNPTTGDTDMGYICPAGHYCEAGVVFERPCPIGHIGANSGLSVRSDSNSATACTPCNTGELCDARGLTAIKTSGV